MTSPRRGLAFALVFAGATVGGMIRFGIDQAFNANVAWDIVAINVVGSIALGVLAGWTARRPQPLLYAAVGPGLLGGFTTFSAMAAISWNDSDPQPHIALLLLTTALAVAGAAAGWIGGSRLGRSGDLAPDPQVVP